ncbi:MAG: cytochrome c3 family protein [Thermodesulfovibrionales bacterium]|nr:cytochrome c3 family protein [Thermodesulfovibrionales bacterium]
MLLLLSVFSAGTAHAANNPAPAEYRPTEEAQICLGCHGDKGMVATLKNGEKLSLYVDDRILRDSVHGSFNCSTCHAGFSADKHPQRTFQSRGSYKAAASAVCIGCHTFKKGIHNIMLKGLKQAVCVDCHGAHSVKKASDSDSCRGCHTYSLSITFGNGETAHFRIDPEEIQESVHSKLRCYDCHFGFSQEEHPIRSFKSKRDLTIIASEGCRRCHFDKYTKTLEGIHYDILSRGNLSAPVCVDCHGSHSISSGRREKVLSARRCQRCHEDIYGVYAKSVHGSALLSEHNQDVPVCADCHKAHDLADPHTVDFRNKTPEMCGNCHANEELMTKYGLSTSVLESYLEDFHGVTVTFYKRQKEAVRHIAVCTDCHGIHDITKVKGPNATVLKSNLLTRCRKCHPGASENFPDTWISHYDPTFKRAPLVYAVTLIYKVFIPFMIIGLVLQILLHIWRYAVNR